MYRLKTCRYPQINVYLVEVLSTLLSDDSCGMDTLVLKLEILKLSFKPVLGLLSAGNLLVEGFNGLLSLSQAD